MAKFDSQMPWVIHKEGVGDLKSPIPYGGYSLGTLKSMAGAGYILLHEGKRVKLSGLTEAMIKKAQEDHARAGKKKGAASSQGEGFGAPPPTAGQSKERKDRKACDFYGWDPL